MNLLEIGKVVPDFKIQATNGLNQQISDYKGKNVVLYFYPKDNTPGCTIESKAFRDAMPQFTAANTVIFGISRDNLISHERFKKAQCLPFELIFDEHNELCELFNVLKHKSMFGKKYIGIERSTFLIDKNGLLRFVWRKVSVLNHVKEVLAAACALN